MVKVATMNVGTSTAAKPAAGSPRPSSAGPKAAAAAAKPSSASQSLKPAPAKPAAKAPAVPVPAPAQSVEMPPPKPVREAAATLEMRVAGENREKEDAARKMAEVEGAKKLAEEEKMKKKTVSAGDDLQVKFTWSACEAQAVQVTGSFGAWQEKTQLVKKGDAWEAELKLKPGEYEYKFIVDGDWCYDMTLPTVTDEGGNINNIITV